MTPRTRLFTPTTIENGPDLNCLKDTRATLLCSSNHVEELIRDIWRDVHLADEDLPSWTGVTVFNKVKTTELSNRAGSSSDDAHLGHVPWTGATPPIPMKLEDPGVFVRREDGVWCRRDTRGRLYPANVHGERIAKIKVYSDGGLCPLISNALLPSDLTFGGKF